MKYPIIPPRTENIVANNVIYRTLFLLIRAIGIIKRSVGIGKKILSIKEIKYKNLVEFLFFIISIILAFIFFILQILVRVGRLELPLCCQNQILNLARLPVPPHPQIINKN